MRWPRREEMYRMQAHNRVYRAVPLWFLHIDAVYADS